MKSALLSPCPVRTSASAHPGKYSRATLAHSIVSGLLSRRRAAASRSRSARPIRAAVSQKSSSVTGQPALEKVGSGIGVTSGRRQDARRGSQWDWLRTSVDRGDHADQQQGRETDHLICSHLVGKPARSMSGDAVEHAPSQ